MIYSALIIICVSLVNFYITEYFKLSIFALSIYKCIVMNCYVRNSSSQFKWALCHLSPHLRSDGAVYCNYFLRYIRPSECFRVLYSSSPMEFYDSKDRLISVEQLDMF